MYNIVFTQETMSSIKTDDIKVSTIFKECRWTAMSQPMTICLGNLRSNSPSYILILLEQNSLNVITHF